MTDTNNDTCDNCGRPLGTEEEMDGIDWENGPIPPKCFSECLFDGDTDPHCQLVAKNNALRSIQDDITKIRELEERVAHAEIARDNALAMRDEAQRMKKQAGESAGRRIEALIALARTYASAASLGTQEDTGAAMMEDFEAKIRNILAKEPPSVAIVVGERLDDLVRDAVAFRNGDEKRWKDNQAMWHSLAKAVGIPDAVPPRGKP